MRLFAKAGCALKDVLSPQDKKNSGDGDDAAKSFDVPIDFRLCV